MLKTTNTTFIEYEKVILGQLAWSVPIRSLIEPLNHKLQYNSRPFNSKNFQVLCSTGTEVIEEPCNP